MRKILIGFLLLVSLNTFGANPTYSDTLTFSTNPAHVSVRNPLLLTTPVSYTNFLFLQSPLVVSGAPAGFTALNGTYRLAWTNAAGGGGFPQAVWTNSTSTNIIYMRDQGANVGGIVIVLEGKTNDANLFYVGAVDTTNNIPISPLEPNEDVYPELSGFNLTVTATANNVINTAYAAQITNVYFEPFGGSTNNVYIDPINGDDNYARWYKYQFAFKTLRAASAVLTNGDNVWFLNGAVYDDTVSGLTTTIPNGVTLHGNNCTYKGALLFTDGDALYDLRVTFAGTHFSCTNRSSSIYAQNCYFYGEVSGDGIDIDAWKGTLVFKDCFMGSSWDAIIVDDTSGLSTTNGIIRLSNCLLQIERTNGVPVTITSGSHGINWLVNSKGGKIILDGGGINVINSTNTAFTSSDGQGNSCFLISYKSGQSAFGTASVELNGPAINYGTTNAGVLVTGISNVVSMPISGWYMSNNLAGALSSPLVHSTHVILNR